MLPTRIRLSLFFQGSGMTSYNFNNNFQVIPFYNNNSYAAYEYYNDHWTKDNQDAKYPIANPVPRRTTRRQALSGSGTLLYLRLKNAQLGYTLPAGVMSR